MTDIPLKRNKMQKIKLYFLFLTAIFTLLASGCSTSSPGGNAEVPAISTAGTEPPYKNKEPEKYQAEIWQVSAQGTDKYFIVRDGTKWRIDSGYGLPEQVTTLHTDKDYVVSNAAKIFTEYPPSHGFDEREGMVSEISLGMLNIRDAAVFKNIGTENELTKYQVTSEAEPNVETIVYVDEKIGLPVKKEIFKVDGGQRTLDRSVILSGFKTTVDPGMFELPKGLRQASIDEMKKVLSGIQ